MMIDFGRCEASDLRDKVYAFLGIAKDGLLVTPDYTAPVEQAYTDVAKAYIKKEGNLEIICTHHRGYNLISLPSWVPDWSICRPSSQNWTVNSMRYSHYSAGYPMPYNTKMPKLGCPVVDGISFEGSHTLKASGVTIGSISEMAHSIDPGSFDTNQWIRSILSWKTEALESGEYINGESNFRAFCLTPTGDANGLVRNHVIPTRHRSQIEELFRWTFKNYSDPTNPSSEKASKSLCSKVQRAMCGVKFARLSSGHMGLVPDASELGDETCVLRGAGTPMVMRRKLSSSLNSEGSLTDNARSEEGSAAHRMIGPCYVHGVMDGEMFEAATELFVIE